MTDQVLRLNATFRDGATPAIRKLKGELGGVKVMPGMMAADEWMGKFSTRGAEFVKSGGNVADIFGAMGIAGLTTAASMAALVGHFKALSEHVLNVKELGREVGLTTNQLNQFAQAGQKFGVLPEAIEGAIEAFKSQMPQFMNSTGQLFDELKGRAPNLVKALKLEDTEHQIKSILEYLGQAKLQTNPQQQKQMADLFFPGHGGDIEKLFAKGPQGFVEEVERMKAKLGPISDQMEKQSENLRQATVGLNQEFEKFELQVGPKFLGWMTDVVKQAEAFFDRVAKVNETQRAGGAKDERDAHPDLTPEQQERIDKAMRTPVPEQPPGPMTRGNRLLHKMSYADDDLSAGASPTSSMSASAMLTEGVKQGVLAAYRELDAERSAAGDGGGQGGVQNASFGGGGGWGGGRGAGGGGAFRGNAGVGGWWTKDRIEHGIDRLMKEAGLSRAGAEGLVSRWATVEAGGWPNSRQQVIGRCRHRTVDRKPEARLHRRLR